MRVARERAPLAAATAPSGERCLIYHDVTGDDAVCGTLRHFASWTPCYIYMSVLTGGLTCAVERRILLHLRGEGLSCVGRRHFSCCDVSLRRSDGSMRFNRKTHRLSREWHIVRYLAHFLGYGVKRSVLQVTRMYSLQFSSSPPTEDRPFSGASLPINLAAEQFLSSISFGRCRDSGINTHSRRSLRVSCVPVDCVLDVGKVGTQTCVGRVPTNNPLKCMYNNRQGCWVKLQANT